MLESREALFICDRAVSPTLVFFRKVIASATATLIGAFVALSALLYAVWRNRIVLVISQSGNPITNRVSPLDGGELGTAYIMDVSIINDSQKPVTLRGFGLGLLWNDPDFHWLHDPLDTRHPRENYEMPGGYLRFPRSMVVNHRIFKEGTMQPGDTIAGLLLAWGGTPIPECFPHASEIEMKLSVYDQRGKLHKALFTFFVSKMG